ncbi:hypothetical protein B0H13DRAFT_2338500 [Mycena leptocephala]|nr:hypothetical protein B0H13DRAFT_2338500 [Mycena leptocephala]
MPFSSQTCSPGSTPASSQPASQFDETKLDPGTIYYARGHTAPFTVRVGYQQARCLDSMTPDELLVMRPTCVMPYHGEPGVDRVEHDGNAGSKFYIVCLGRIQGTYVSDKKATDNVRGYRNGRSLGVHHWDDAEREWADCCLRWHGPVCPNARPRVTMETRVHLNPALLAPVEKWAVKGLEHAFAAAAAQDLKVIHVLGSRDELSLKIWAGMSG